MPDSVKDTGGDPRRLICRQVDHHLTLFNRRFDVTSQGTRVAVVQAGSVLFDTPRTLAKLKDFVAEAAGRGAKLAVFPEAFLGGYTKGIDFGCRVGSRSPEGREWFRRYFEA